jgi:hypothetical protein
MGRLYNFEYWMSYGGADHDAFKWNFHLLRFLKIIRVVHMLFPYQKIRAFIVLWS